MALPGLDGGGRKDETWEISPNSPKKPEGSHLLHQLPQFPTPAVSGAGALCGDHSCADAFPIRGLSRSIQLPAFFWALEKGLWRSHGLESRKPEGTHPALSGGEKGAGETTDAFCWIPEMCGVTNAQMTRLRYEE